MPSSEVLREIPPVAVQAPTVLPSVIAKGAVQQSLGFLAVVGGHLKQKGIAESLVGGVLGIRPDVLAPVVELVTLESS